MTLRSAEKEDGEVESDTGPTVRPLEGSYYQKRRETDSQCHTAYCDIHRSAAHRYYLLSTKDTVGSSNRIVP